ncbi:hypothetical protein X976_1866 [Burkholderia pseudomallei MSHR7500]|nr:hypothetical protein X976_1866 [Burkholderia pseudomallei MSHR7500]
MREMYDTGLDVELIPWIKAPWLHDNLCPTIIGPAINPVDRAEVVDFDGCYASKFLVEIEHAVLIFFEQGREIVVAFGYKYNLRKSSVGIVLGHPFEVFVLAMSHGEIKNPTMTVDKDSLPPVFVADIVDGSQRAIQVTIDWWICLSPRSSPINGARKSSPSVDGQSLGVRRHDFSRWMCVGQLRRPFVNVCSGHVLLAFLQHRGDEIENDPVGFVNHDLVPIRGILKVLQVSRRIEHPSHSCLPKGKAWKKWKSI